MDVDEDDEDEEWHLNVKEDNIQDEIDMDEIEDVMDAEEIVKEWQISIPFINRGMKYLCTQFTDNTPMPYAYMSLIFANHLELMNNLVSVNNLVQNHSWKWKSLIFMFNGI
jgi:hypothetical protein